jgi:hypothetical protein
MTQKQSKIADKDTVISLVIGENAEGKLQVIPELSVRTLQDIEKKYNAPNFPRTEATNPRGWAEWGGSDNLPNFIDRRIASVPFAKRVLYRMAQDMCGKGVVLVTKKDFYEGNFVKTYHVDAANFLDKNFVNTKWLFPQAFAKMMFANHFTQIDLDARKKAVRLFHLDSMFCRISKQNMSNFEIEYLKFCGKFGSLEMPADNDIKTIPLYKWYRDDFFSWLKGDSYAYHSKSVNIGTTYYPRPIWITLLEKDTWLDVAKKVPHSINKLGNNQVKPKYHLKVSVDYFKFKYPDWSSYVGDKASKRTELIDAFEQKIEDSLSGADNAGKMITTYHFEENGKFLGLVELVAIDDKLKENNWIPSSLSANNEIINAFGYHASQMSMMGDTGKGMGAGSGSDTRVHFNSGILRNTLEQMELLEPLNHIFQINGWDVVAMIDDLGQTTTDKSKSGIVSNKDLTPQ